MLQIDKKSEYNKELYKLLKEVKLIRKNLIRKFIEHIKVPKQKITCSGGGCYGCCYQIVGTFFFEGVLIADNLIKYNRLETVEKLIDHGERQVKLYGNSPFINDKDVALKASDNWMAKGELCPLLDNDKKCVVYGLRPAACASWFVTSPQEKCYPPPKGKVLCFNNQPVFSMMYKIDAQFISHLLRKQIEVSLPTPLGHAVTTGVLLLTKGPSAILPKYL